MIERNLSPLMLRQIWKRLGLEATSVVNRPTGQNVTSWDVTLDHYSQQDVPQQRKLHKLMPDLPYHDAHPPPGVRVFMLESVYLKMALTRTHAKIARRASRHARSDTFVETQGEASDVDMLSIEPATDSMEQICWDDDLDDCDLLEVDSISAQMPQGHTDNLIQEPDATGGALGDSAYPSPPSSQNVREQDPHERHVKAADHVVHTNSVIAILDVGLRYAIFSPPPRKRDSVTVVSNEDFKHLSDIAPSLWLPEYHRSIAARAPLLPTISHAIANLARNRATGGSLGAKVKELARRYRQTSGRTCFEGECTQPNGLQEALATRLWQIMTADSLDVETTKWAQPLSGNANTREAPVPCQTAEAMLDTNNVVKVSDQPSTGSNPGNLLNLLSEVEEEGPFGLEDQNELQGNAMVTNRGHLSWTQQTMKEASARWDLEDLPGCDPSSELTDDEPWDYESDEELHLSGTFVPCDTRIPEGHCGLGVEPKNSSRKNGSMLLYDSRQIPVRMTPESLEAEMFFCLQEVDPKDKGSGQGLVYEKGEGAGTSNLELLNRGYDEREFLDTAE